MADLSHLSRVLVVEDEALIALDMEATLRDAGVAEIVLAVTIEEAMALADQHELDSAVLDLHLGRDGWTYDVAQRLQQRGVPFIFSSGTVDVADGFRDVPLVGKPFSSEELLTALAQVTTESAGEAAE